ncbi:MAG: GIY-YIG nuclease family protein [Methanothrix sp.]|jgi:Uncharacterized conserved protein|uniref:GIY-YIG domain-containing protein n=1 Tax=Methanothrix harundinacea TaxID=301375 RepID=A0A101FUL6_9EURY|nr:MAG: endonuclease III [Methanosaeta sp. SDB]KUK44745.1 MAG: hypothetical protein XD72_0850 [Methanothrix harundinacea]MDD2637576.1 GIY-YIG nuclease family protein [Methanothrix sp.]MDI9399492.1 GIY-YIG nuclease family protein [Euryarchaeota archaeon]MCP1392902.1 GIY-YIG nuclease family protein [Methanothrix harundinacea]
MEKGIYTIILRLEADRDIVVGSLGPIHFRAGYYAYTGSARGPGGLARVERHMRVLEGKNAVQRWHIDRLLPHTTLVEVVATKTEEDLECPIARKIGEKLSFVGKFGCTDCRCASHLHFSQDQKEILEAVWYAHAQVRSGSYEK